MIRSKKLLVTIEVDLLESDHVTLDATTPADLPEAQAELAHEQALLDALRADPVRYADFITTLVVGRLEGLRITRMVPELANLDDAYTASVEILESLIPELPPTAQAYFQQDIHPGWVLGCLESIFEAIQVNPLRLTVAHPQRND